MSIRAHPWLFCVLLLAGFCGCSADRPLNPSFPLTMAQARRAWREMETDPKPLQRPVIVVGGIYDPGLVAGHVARHLRKITADDSRIIHVSFFEISSFEDCANKLIRKVDQAFPTDDPSRTVEVDVVGFSMGGLAARYAASEADTDLPSRKRRLNMARLFTIGTPHRGAKLAWVPTFDRRIIDMRADSLFLARLNDEGLTYQIIPYARLGDWVVGADNAAPPGRIAWWLADPFSLAHLMAGHDVRILSDIARRLRGEQPYTIEPAATLPSGGKGS